MPLLTQVAADHPAITKAWADNGYRPKVTEGDAALGVDVEVVRRDPATSGFTALPRRWVIERTFGWLMLHRRLVRDYEALPARSEAMIHVAMIDLMTRRLTRESTPTLRDTLTQIRQNSRDQTPTAALGSFPSRSAGPVPSCS
ncbi:transposase [Sphaerisporangium flaviroseum]|uniref:transposase n=1 Tax=Sphaerisporangium flaviroseum TaxID=509199 RepID=UPI003CD05919